MLKLRFNDFNGRHMLGKHRNSLIQPASLDEKYLRRLEGENVITIYDLYHSESDCCEL